MVNKLNYLNHTAGLSRILSDFLKSKRCLIEYVLRAGLKQVSEGIEDECQLEVNGGIALIEEAREQIRALQSKLAQREHIKQLDENNRLLVAGLSIVRFFKLQSPGEGQAILMGRKQV